MATKVAALLLFGSMAVFSLYILCFSKNSDLAVRVINLPLAVFFGYLLRTLWRVRLIICESSNEFRGLKSTKLDFSQIYKVELAGSNLVLRSQDNKLTITEIIADRPRVIEVLAPKLNALPGLVTKDEVQLWGIKPHPQGSSPVISSE